MRWGTITVTKSNIQQCCSSLPSAQLVTPSHKLDQCIHRRSASHNLYSLGHATSTSNAHLIGTLKVDIWWWVSFKVVSLHSPPYHTIRSNVSAFKNNSLGNFPYLCPIVSSNNNKLVSALPSRILH